MIIRPGTAAMTGGASNPAPSQPSPVHPHHRPPPTVVLARPPPPASAARPPIQQTLLVNSPTVRVTHHHGGGLRPPQSVVVGGSNVALAAAGTPTTVRLQTVPSSSSSSTSSLSLSTAVSGRNVVINQPGSQITVPLQTLQTLQPGQGIPTGQAGHLLVKTDNGQYQILRVGSSASSASSSTVTATTSLNQQLTTTTIRPSNAVLQRSPAVVVASTPPPSQSISSSSTNSTTSTSSSSSTSTSSASSGMAGQMTPDTAKLKCKNFLATLLRLASEQPEIVARNVRNLIQGLIDGQVDPEVFTTRLQRELNSSPQPCLVPFLKRSLPYLQHSLSTNELTIDGVRAPRTVVGPPQTSAAVGPPNLGSSGPVRIPVRSARIPQTNLVQQTPRPILTVNRPMMTINRPAVGPLITTTATPQPSIASPAVVARSSHLVPKPFIPAPSTSSSASSASSLAIPSPVRMPSSSFATTPTPSTSSSMMMMMKEKKSSGTFSVAGDEDINDVAAMGGVNLQEESQRMQSTVDMIGTQIRSCKDETFLQTGLLHQRIAKICQDRGLDEPSSDVIALVSHATQDRLKTLLEKLSVMAEHRMDIVKLEGQYEVTQDVKAQLRFLGDLDKLERRRHEEAERELLLRAAKSRTKTEDPEREKLKAKAKELQRVEEEQLRHEKANNTALLASGGPRHKKFKLDDTLAAAGTSKALSMPIRPRIRRVHLRDLLFLMEQEKELKRNPLLWKSYCA